MGNSRERRTLRWNARRALWSASTLKSVRCCSRNLSYVGDGTVTVKQSDSSAGYSSLGVYGSPWSYARCSAVITAHRSVVIGNAFSACQANGGDVTMMSSKRFSRPSMRSRIWRTTWHGMQFWTDGVVS